MYAVAVAPTGAWGVPPARRSPPDGLDVDYPRPERDQPSSSPPSHSS